MAGQSPASNRYSKLSDDSSTTKFPFESFVEAQNLIDTFEAFKELCESAGVQPFTDHEHFFSNLKAGVRYWKAVELWKEIDKRVNRIEYNKGKACPDTKVFIVGAGPCGLRAAIELALLGSRVVLVEKRNSFTRNNVLYLWSYLITDLTNLGAKKFYGRFGAGDINHISIIKLQTILLKVALLLGVEIHYNVEFLGIDEKPKKEGWRAQVKPKDHPVSKYEFDVIISADGRQNTLSGFTWKESARSLAIGITGNFVNMNSQKDALTKEISGKSYIYDQEFFQGLKESKNIDLENIVYYKDETHYFVMTAKKQSLVEKGVLKKDENDTEKLLAPGNVNDKMLQEYALEAALYATEGKLPTEEFALNDKGQPDIAVFDFTSRKQATKAALSIEENGKTLIMAIVGDSLKEPFWPEGTGCALGFLGVFDTVWMIRNVAVGDRTMEEALRDREVIYKLLSNTKPEDLNKNFNNYGIDPRTRYTSQVAKRKDLYKEEPLAIQDEQRQRPVSEFIPRDRTGEVRSRFKSTPAFNFKNKKLSEVEEEVGVKGGKGKTQSVKSKENKKQKSLKGKDKGNVTKEERKNKGTENKEEKKQRKIEKQNEKERKAEQKRKDKEDKKKKKEMKKQGKGNTERIAETDAEEDLSWQEKSRSLNRRQFDFNASLNMFREDTGTPQESPVRISPEEPEQPTKKKKGSIWRIFKIWKSSKSKDDKGKNKKKEKTKAKKTKDSIKHPTDETDSYQKLNGDSPARNSMNQRNSAISSMSSLGTKSSPNSPSKDTDYTATTQNGTAGNKDKNYAKMSDSDEEPPRQEKTERSNSILKILKPGKRKNQKYNSLQMEIEAERAIGS